MVRRGRPPLGISQNTWRLYVDQETRLRQMSADTGRSMAEHVRTAVDAYLARSGYLRPECDPDHTDTVT